MFAIGEERVVWSMKGTRWLVERLRNIEDLNPAAESVRLVIENELENRNPRPIVPSPGEAATLYELAAFYADAFPLADEVIRLRDALAAAGYGPPHDAG